MNHWKFYYWLVHLQHGLMSASLCCGVGLEPHTIPLLLLGIVQSATGSVHWSFNKLFIISGWLSPPWPWPIPAPPPNKCWSSIILWKLSLLLFPPLLPSWLFNKLFIISGWLSPSGPWPVPFPLPNKCWSSIILWRLLLFSPLLPSLISFININWKKRDGVAEVT